MSALQGNRVCEPYALHVDIPPAASFELAFLLLDVTRTLSDRGELLDGVAERLGALRGMLEPRLLSADPFQRFRLQLVIGDDRAEVLLHHVERLENGALF